MKSSMELTEETAGWMLEPIRRHLRIDGGDVHLVKVKGNVMHVRMEGYCNNCSRRRACFGISLARKIPCTS